MKLLVAVPILFMMFALGGCSGGSGRGFDLYDWEESIDFGRQDAASADEWGFPRLCHLLSDATQRIGLYYRGQSFYFDWLVAARGIEPPMLYYDLGGGKSWLFFSVIVGVGTGVSLLDLHVLVFEADNSFTHYFLSADSVREWFFPPMYTEAREGGDGHIFHFVFDDEVHIIDFGPGFMDGDFVGMHFGSVVGFDFVDGRIKARVAIGANFEHYLGGYFFGEVLAVVVFDDREFVVSDFKFVLYS